MSAIADERLTKLTEVQKMLLERVITIGGGEPEQRESDIIGK